MNDLSAFTQNPAFGVTLSLAAWSVAERVHRKLPWLHPLIFSGVVVIAFLVLTGIPFEHYQNGGAMIKFWLGTATVALAIPLYKYATIIREALFPVLTGILVGALTGVFSAWLVVWALGGDKSMIASMMPKSTTTPIAVALTVRAGGIPELTAVYVIVTGLLGVAIGVPLLKRIGVHDHAAVGTAMGCAAHATATAKLMADHELRGSFSGLAMGLCGITTSLVMMPIRL